MTLFDISYPRNVLTKLKETRQCKSIKRFFYELLGSMINKYFCKWIIDNLYTIYGTIVIYNNIVLCNVI